jgi:hypothetical protein
MADSFSLFLTRRNDGSTFKFRSTRDLCSFLGISTPYCKCIACAPYARNAPYCSRPINRANQAKVPGLLSRLVDIRIPSTRVGRLLEELSSCVVCGITGWHQNKADEVYREWCYDLWGEYLRANNLDPRLSIWVPQQLNQPTWERDLERARTQQQHDPEETNVTENEDDQDGPESPRPDSPNSVFSETGPGRGTPSRNHGNTQRSSRPAFSVYRDTTTDAPPVSGSLFNERVTSSAMEHRPPLRYRDQNIPVSSARASSNTSVSSGHRRSEAGPSSSGPSGPRFGESNAVPHNAADCPEEGEASNSTQSTGITIHGRDEQASSQEISRNQSLVVVTESPVTPEDSAPADRQETSEENESEAGPVTEPEVEEQLNASSYGSHQDQPNLQGNSEDISQADREDNPEDNPEDNVEDIDEESHASSHGLHEDQPNLQENSQESNQDSRQEDDIASTTAEVHSDEDQLTQSSSNDNAELECDFSPELLDLLEAFDDNNIDTETPINSSPERSITVARGGFRLYSQSQPLALFRTLYNRIRQTVATSRNCAGYIYTFRRPALPGFLKIGYVRGRIVANRPYPHPVDNRLARWTADCGHPVEEVFRVRIAKAVERIEGLTHMTLQEYRRVEDPPCARCKGRSRRTSRDGRRRSNGAHDEWFEIDEDTVRTVVELWSQFSMQEPYDHWGRLGAFWSQKIESDKAERERLEGARGEGDAGQVVNYIRSWVERMPEMIAEKRRWEFRDMLGSYLLGS